MVAVAIAEREAVAIVWYGTIPYHTIPYQYPDDSFGNQSKALFNLFSA
jgi:hypothetical protein